MPERIATPPSASRRGGEIAELVLSTLDRLGVPFEDRGNGVFEALLEPPVWEASPRGHLVFAFDEEAAREDGVDLVTFGHPFLTAIVERALALAPASEAHVRVRSLDPEAAGPKLRTQVSFDKARPGSPSDLALRLGRIWRFDLRLCLTSDLVEEVPLPVFLESSTGLPLPEWRSIELDVSPDPVYLLPLTRERPLDDLAALARALAATEGADLEAATRARLAQERQAEERRIRSFFTAQREGLRSRRRAGGAPDERTLGLLATEEAARLKDLDVKYGLEASWRLDRVVAYRVPLFEYRLPVQVGTDRHALRGLYDPVSGRHLGFTCPACRRATREVLGDRGRGIVCPGCRPPTQEPAPKPEPPAAPPEAPRSRTATAEVRNHDCGPAEAPTPPWAETDEPVERPRAPSPWILKPGRLSLTARCILFLARAERGQARGNLAARPMEELTARSFLDLLQRHMGPGLAWPVADRRKVVGSSPAVLTTILDARARCLGSHASELMRDVTSMITRHRVPSRWVLYNGIVKLQEDPADHFHGPVFETTEEAYFLLALVVVLAGSHHEVSDFGWILHGEGLVPGLEEVVSHTWGQEHKGGQAWLVASTVPSSLPADVARAVGGALKSASWRKALLAGQSPLEVRAPEQFGILLEFPAAGRFRAVPARGEPRPPPAPRGARSGKLVQKKAGGTRRSPS